MIYFITLLIVGAFFGLQNIKINEVKAEVATLRENLETSYELIAQLEYRVQVLEDQLPK